MKVYVKSNTVVRITTDNYDWNDETAIYDLIRYMDDKFNYATPMTRRIPADPSNPNSAKYVLEERFVVQVGDPDPINYASDADVRLMKHTEFKIIFNARMLDGATTRSLDNNFKVDIDFDSTNKLNSLRSLAIIAGLEGVSIRDYDNNTQLISMADFDKVLVEIGMDVQALFSTKNDLQDAAASLPIEEVKVLHWI
jgi:hypothetical protein